MANWWDGAAWRRGYNSDQRMNYALVGAQLMAVWSMKLNIAWPRFFVAMLALGCMIVAGAWLERKGRGDKK